MNKPNISISFLVDADGAAILAALYHLLEEKEPAPSLWKALPRALRLLAESVDVFLEREATGETGIDEDWNENEKRFMRAFVGLLSFDIWKEE